MRVYKHVYFGWKYFGKRSNYEEKNIEKLSRRNETYETYKTYKHNTYVF